MATNTHFNNYGYAQEQSLIEDLVIESIKMYGLDCYYIPRIPVARDSIFQEDDLARYTSAYAVEMYIKNVEGFEGEGDFLSKFGLEVRDSVTFTVAQKRYRDAVSNNIATADTDGDGTSDTDAADRGTNAIPLTERRPLEGDLLYFPLNKKIFEIQHVEHEAEFYQMGSLQTFDLKCELFEYSNERFYISQDSVDNGYITAAQKTAIEAVFAAHRTVTPGATINDADTIIEDIDDIANSSNTEIQNAIAADNIIDFSQSNPFGDDIF